MTTAQKPTTLSAPFTFNIVTKLGCSKANVFLIYSSETEKYYAMKLFNYEDDKINLAYQNESRFSFLSHPNIISTVALQDRKRVQCKGKHFNASFIISELGRYRDLSTLAGQTDLFSDERFLRTYFHQLIEGLEYLHSNGVAHLDLKPENLLLGEDLKLKITDFDAAFMRGDFRSISRGTRNYRPPEIRDGCCQDPYAADIYSAAITLFVLKTSQYPFLEEVVVEGYDLAELMFKEDPEFWLVHEKWSHNKTKFEESFITLFKIMTKVDIIERATLEEIKNSEWYKGPIYSEAELRNKLSKYLPELDILKKTHSN